MKCPGCGAEIGDSSVCEFCGTKISANLQVEEQKAQEQLNKQGCPKCGSSNIEFKRENLGEVRGKDHKRIVHTTVGYCKDCGYTWYPEGETAQVPKKRKTWLWVLGWICCFPIPLTILMLRKKDIKPILKYGIIALAWIVYIGIGISGGGSDSTETPDTSEPVQEEVVDEESGSSAAITLTAGELGEYGKEIVMNEGTDMPENLIVYYVPAGDYTVKNVGDKMTQVSVYEGFARDESTGYDDYTSVGDTPTIEAGETADISVPDGWFIEIHEPAVIELVAK